MSTTVTVVVPVKDRRERMMRCLDALLAQDHEAYDVLVLDNGSTDGTAEACRRRAAAAQVPLRVEVIHGTVGRLRNRAAALTDSDALAFTDSDCMPAPGWVSAGVTPLTERPEVGLVQGRTLPERGMEMRGWTATIEVTSYTGRFESCNLFVRREAFAAVDGFDEQVGHFWEDTAAGLSMLRAGWEAEFCHEALVYHDVTYPGLRWFLKRAQRYGNAAAVVRRYPEARRELLWARYFLRARNAKTVAAVAGLLLAPLDRRALVLTLPFLHFHMPPSPHPRAVKAQAEGALFDLSILLGMVRGSIRHRTLVL